jgi:uncharacterized heparinase superfamily protein
MKVGQTALEARSINFGEIAEISVAAGLRTPTAATYWRTLRHLRWSQLGYLVLRRVLPRSTSPAEVMSPISLRELPTPWPFMEWQPQASRKMLTTRDFTFLNKTIDCNGSIPWNDHRHARLWLYHLNYFDFLNVSFELPEEETTLKSALEITLDWCAHNTQGTEVGWEPYALSVRIVNWLKFLIQHQRSLELLGLETEVKTFIESLGTQAATLERRLEKDLRGNHLLKNIKALLFAGAMLDTRLSTRWRAKGQRLLEQELNEQILLDGGHFERSPMYHAQILEDLTEIRLLYDRMGLRLACADLLLRKIDSMTRFLRAILHPDGEIPLFNDSVLGGARPTRHLLAMTESPEGANVESEPYTIVFPESGYGVIRSAEARSTLIFDCGPLGPDYQPGHGHCDVLSYELSLGGQRVVVDTGVSTYGPAPERAYERSTAAHNTVRVDDEEQAEIWASFRVGRRPRVGELLGGNDGPFHFLSGEHHAYRRLGVAHTRTILFHAPDTWIVADLLRGNGSHLVESFLHFHPQVRLEPVAEHTGSSDGPLLRRWTVECSHQPYLLTAYGDGEFDIHKSWYAERFGDRQPSTALRWTCKGAIPTGMIHMFTPTGTPPPHLVADWPANSIDINGRRIPLR